MDKQKAIKKEIDKLNKILVDVPQSKKDLCAKLIQNAAFMASTLDELQETINKEGVVITAKNGNGFDVTQEHPAQKSYNTMINRYASVTNQLLSLLPDQKADGINKAGEALANFVAKGKKIELR